MRKGRPYDAGFTGPAMVKRAIAAYLGSTSFLDYNVGRVLDALRQSGLEDSTRVIYGSDHGENLGTRGLWAKNTLYEESAGIPLIMAGPDIPQGRVIGDPVTLEAARLALAAFALASSARLCSSCCRWAVMSFCRVKGLACTALS